MKARDIYHILRSITDKYYVYTDQLTVIAKWIEAEFEYKPQKLVNNVNVSIVNWIACSDKLPEDTMGSYLVCLKNNT